jgi:AhpC/TSA family
MAAVPATAQTSSGTAAAKTGNTDACKDSCAVDSTQNTKGKGVKTDPKLQVAPEWSTTEWFNSDPLSLTQLRGQVVYLHAFQMLCPGCILKGIPQAQRVFESFRGAKLAVVGLHTVFEHHRAMEAHALEAFLHEFRISFPVGIDAAGTARIPKTMQAYGMQGTPTTVLIDATGRLRKQVFGAYEDLLLGADLQSLMMEAELDP